MRKQNTRTKRVKGGCDCANNTLNLPFFKGGNTVASLTSDLPANVYYQKNTYEHDPQNSSMLVNTRNLPNMSSVVSGGNKKRSTRRERKVRGGMASFDAVSNGLNPTSIVGVYNLMRMDTGIDSSVTSQPIKSYGVDNPPLI